MTRGLLGKGLAVAFALAGCATGPTPAPVVRSPALEAGRRLYLAKCTLCHGAIDPADYPRAAWPKLVELYGRRARLRPEAQAQILAYLQANAR